MAISNNGLTESQNYSETSYMKKQKKKIMRKKYTSVVKTTLTRQATFTTIGNLTTKYTESKDLKN